MAADMDLWMVVVRGCSKMACQLV